MSHVFTNLCICLFLLLLSCRVYADVELPGVFGDHMLLQRDRPLKIWGWAEPQEEVSITFAGKTYQTTAEGDKTWQAILPPMHAGGPYDLLIKGKNQLILTNILIGDVWICGGQSNMQYLMKWLGNRYEGEIAQAANPQIRLIRVNDNKSTTPLKDMQTEGWKEATPATVLDFSAIAYFFGKELNEKYNIPIGLISVNMGATPAEAWTSIEALQDFPHYTQRLEEVRKIENLYRANLAAWEKEMSTLYTETNTARVLAEDITSWKSMVVPGKWNYSMAPDSEAVIYFAREFELPDSWVNKDLTLFLGRIDDNDITYVNGNRVGGMGEYKNYHVPRAYSIPHSYLKRGNNRLMIRVNDRWLNGGLTGPQNSMRISDGRESIALAGEWRYKLIGTFRIPSTPTFDYSIRTPGVLYNAMLHPLINFAIKGAIWYQGEGNTSIAYEYRKLFPAMIRDWRSQWNQGDFPFLFVQLASYLPPAKEPQESEWAELREAQVMALALPNTGMAVTIDIGEADDIHPKNKADVGRRLALSARKVAYGEDVVYAGPMYQSMQKEGNKIRLTFTHTGGGLVAKGGDLRGFAIASKDGKFVWANARIEGSIVVVWHDKVKSPQAVRYAWGDNPQKANFYNLEGLPASPFRTDQWPGITEKKIVYPPEADKAVK